MKKQLLVLFLALFSIAQAKEFQKVPVSTSTQLIKWSGALIPAMLIGYLFKDGPNLFDEYGTKLVPTTSDKVVHYAVGAFFSGMFAWVGYHFANWFTKEGKMQWSLKMLDAIENHKIIKAINEIETVEEAAKVAYPHSQYPLADAFDKLEQYQMILKRAESILQNMKKVSDDFALQTIATQELPRIKPLVSMITTAMQALRELPGFLDEMHMKTMYEESSEMACE